MNNNTEYDNTLENNIYEAINAYYIDEEFTEQHADLIVKFSTDIENIYNINNKKKREIAEKKWDEFINCMNNKIITCALCLEDKEDLPDNFTQTVCGHKFCYNCSHSQGFLNLKSCPLCRHPINITQSPNFEDLEEYHERQNYLQQHINPASSILVINHIHNNVTFDNEERDDNPVNNSFFDGTYNGDIILAWGSLYYYHGNQRETFTIDTPDKINIKNKLNTLFKFIDDIDYKNDKFISSRCHYYINYVKGHERVKEFNDTQTHQNPFYCKKRHKLNKSHIFKNICPDDINQIAMFKVAVYNLYMDVLDNLRYCKKNDESNAQMPYRLILWILQCYRAVLYKVKMNMAGVQHFNIPSQYKIKPLYVLPNKSYKADITKTKIFSINFNGFDDCYDNRFTMKVISIRNEEHKKIKNCAEKYHEIINPQAEQDPYYNWNLNFYDNNQREFLNDESISYIYNDNFEGGEYEDCLKTFENHFSYIFNNEEDEEIETQVTDKFFNENVFNTIEYFNENPVPQS